MGLDTTFYESYIIMFLCLGLTTYLHYHSMYTAEVFQHGD